MQRSGLETGTVVKTEVSLDEVMLISANHARNAARNRQAYFIVYLVPVITLFISAYIGHLVSESTDIKGLDVLAGTPVAGRWTEE